MFRWNLRIMTKCSKNLLSMSFCASVNLSVFESSRRCTLNWVSMSGKLMRRRGSGLGVPVIRSLTPSTTTVTCRCLTARCSCFDWARDSMREAEVMVMAKRSSRRASSPAPAIAGLLLRPVSRRHPSAALESSPVSSSHTCFSHTHTSQPPTEGSWSTAARRGFSGCGLWSAKAGQSKVAWVQTAPPASDITTAPGHWPSLPPW